MTVYLLFKTFKNLVFTRCQNHTFLIKGKDETLCGQNMVTLELHAEDKKRDDVTAILVELNLT